MKKVVFVVLVLIGFTAHSQTTQQTSAPGWELSLMSVSSSFTVAQFNRQQALSLQEEQSEKIGPYIFGENYPVQIDLVQEATPKSLSNGGSVHQYLISAPSATSLNFIIDEFYLPEGAELYLYNPERTQVIGAYTSQNNNDAKILGTELIEDDEVIVELYLETPSLMNIVELKISQITCGFRSLNKVASEMLRDFDDSEDCNIDVNCPLGNGWENQIRSVAMIIANGNGACSGALVNNTLNDGTPYFLTADHCGTDPTSWVFRFRWESDVPSCATTVQSGNGAPYYESVNGAVTRASNAGSDFHLIELNTAPNPAWDIYYAGWDRTDNPVTQGTGIHHPSGDIKKICRDDNTLTQTVWSGADCWEVSDWDQGVTEPGSSGSPLFDQNGRIVGQLYGGTAACSGTNDNNEPDFYGRFGVSWNGASAAERLSDWLDPNNSGVTVLDGYNPLTITNDDDILVASAIGVAPIICNEDQINVEFEFRNNGFNTLTSLEIYAELNGTAQLLTTWTGSLASGDYETVNLPAISLTDGQNQELKIYSANPNGVADEDTSNDTLTFEFDAKTAGHLVTLEYSIDCFASEVSMEVTGALSGASEWTLQQGELQDEATFGTDGTQQFCMTDTCGTLTINDAGGDGWNAGAGDGCFAGIFGVSLDILNETGTGIASLADPAFGSQVNIDFCKSGFSNTIALESNQEVNVYPNPARNLVTIESHQPVTVELTNMDGKTVKLTSDKEKVHTISLDGLAKGIYLIKWNSGTNFGQQKLIKN